MHRKADALRADRGMDAIIASRDHEERREGQNCHLQGQIVIESDRAGSHVRVSVCGMNIGVGCAYWPILSKTVAARIMSSTLG
jgi:hypothetical protein